MIFHHLTYNKMKQDNCSIKMKLMLLKKKIKHLKKNEAIVHI